MSTRPRALVADDEPNLRSLFSTFLGREYEVTAVSNGAAAERALVADPPIAVAVLDCDMPEMTGPEAVKRAREAGCQVPVLLVSGSGKTPAVVMEDPLTAFLAKPFNRAQLFEALGTLLSSSA